MPLKDDLLAIERALWSGGAETYREHLDDDCVIAFTEMAGVYSRDQVAAMVESGPRWRDVALEVEGMLQPADDIAILTYRARATRGESEHYHALIGSGYIRRGGEWKMIFHQQTPLAE